MGDTLTALIEAKTSWGFNPIYDKKIFVNKYKKIFQGVGQRTAQRLESSVKEHFAEPGGAVHPIQWTTPKQRRYFFWAVKKKIIKGYTLDDKGNITSGYKRTGAVTEAWEVTWFSDPQNLLNGDLTLQNDNPVTRYVHGGFTEETQQQQRFHLITGWANAVIAAEGIWMDAQRIIREEYDEALSGFGALIEGGI